MKNVIKKLKTFASQIDLSKRFDYNFDPSDKLFNASEQKELSTHTSPFDLNKKLKWILHEKYKTGQDSTGLDFWIVNTWGGIRGFKQENNVEKVAKFKTQLIKRKLTVDAFNTISSLSKIASFVDPNHFVVYDSRVIYTLNWLVLTTENQKALKEKYFPMPSGRNKKLSDFDLKTIINLSHLPEYSTDKGLYRTRQLAYFEFCDFIKNNVQEICGKNAKPYELEMLLFTLTDREIFNALREKIKITFDNDLKR